MINNYHHWGKKVEKEKKNFKYGWQTRGKIYVMRCREKKAKRRSEK